MPCRTHNKTIRSEAKIQQLKQKNRKKRSFEARQNLRKNNPEAAKAIMQAPDKNSANPLM
jgi:hypothetical protein